MKRRRSALHPTRRRFLKCGLAAALASQRKAMGSALLLGGDSTRKKNCKAKIWPDSQNQTIGFELLELPGEKFKVVIPELVSDAQEPIVPWAQASPNWEIGEDRARWSVEIPKSVRMEAKVHFASGQIETRVKVTNLSHRTWEKVNAFTCFAYYSAPSFDDPELTRTCFPVNGKWKSVAELYAEHNPGDGPYTFFPVAGGPRLEELWLGKKIPQHHPQVVSKGCACVVSRDGKWIAGMTTRVPAYVFNNRRERCIHADPFMGSVRPGETTEGVATIHILRGALADFMKNCDAESAMTGTAVNLIEMR